MQYFDAQACTDGFKVKWSMGISVFSDNITLGFSIMPPDKCIKLQAELRTFRRVRNLLLY